MKESHREDYHAWLRAAGDLCDRAFTLEERAHLWELWYERYTPREALNELGIE